MRITLLNYAVPEDAGDGGGTRWWHKAGSRWPATIVDRPNDGEAYFPWPFLLAYLHSLLAADGHEVATLDGCLLKLRPDEVEKQARALAPEPSCSRRRSKRSTVTQRFWRG